MMEKKKKELTEKEKKDLERLVEKMKKEMARA